MTDEDRKIDFYFKLLYTIKLILEAIGIVHLVIHFTGKINYQYIKLSSFHYNPIIYLYNIFNIIIIVSLLKLSFYILYDYFLALFWSKIFIKDDYTEEDEIDDDK